jgi:hypothetical protein
VHLTDRSIRAFRSSKPGMEPLGISVIFQPLRLGFLQGAFGHRWEEVDRLSRPALPRSASWAKATLTHRTMKCPATRFRLRRVRAARSAALIYANEY